MERSRSAVLFWIFTTSLISNIASEPGSTSSKAEQNYSGKTVPPQGPRITDPNQAFVANPFVSVTGQENEVELSISCTGLTDHTSNPMCVTFLQSFPEPELKEIHRTEVVPHTSNPAFLEKPVLQFAVSDKKTVVLKIYDAGQKLEENVELQELDYLGMVTYDLADLIKRGKVTIPLIERNGKVSKTTRITIVAEKLIYSQDKVYMELAGYNIVKKDRVGHSNPFIQISKISNSGQEKLVYRTEVMQNTGTIHWKPIMLGLRSLCNGNYGRTLIFKCWDWDGVGNSDYIGQFSTTLNDILKDNPGERSYQLINSFNGNSIGGNIKFLDSDVEIMPTLGDYVRGGLRMHRMIAIDFTNSNGCPTDPTSLHYRIEGISKNKYESAIHSVADTLRDYYDDKMFTLYGFGAEYPPGTPVSYAFNLNQNGADCHGVEEVLDTYRRALSNIKLSQPENFAPLIRKAAEIAAGSASQQYNYLVLFILTDGEISDMPETQSALAEASHLPISVFIVGIGGKSFVNMVQLDNHADATAMSSVPTHRDIVKFLPLKEYNNNEMLLARDVLEELRDHVMSLMKLRGYPPRTAVFVNDGTNMSPPQGRDASSPGA